MPVTVYVLRSLAKSSRYVGITNHLERRLIEHRTQTDTVSKQLGSFQVILTEEYPNHKLARKREKWLKSGAGREWLDEYERNAGSACGG